MTEFSIGGRPVPSISLPPCTTSTFSSMLFSQLFDQQLQDVNVLAKSLCASWVQAPILEQRVSGKVALCQIRTERCKTLSFPHLRDVSTLSQLRKRESVHRPRAHGDSCVFAQLRKYGKLQRRQGMPSIAYAVSIMSQEFDSCSWRGRAPSTETQARFKDFDQTARGLVERQ